MLIPQITYRTNDSWELASAIDGDNGWPILHDADYLDGQLQVLTIPENFADLSNYPEPVLNAIRRVVTASAAGETRGARQGEPVRLRQRHVHRAQLPR